MSNTEMNQEEPHAPEDEAVAAEPEAPEADDAPADPVATLAAEVERLKEEAQKYRDQALRAMAEQENIRKRSERDKENIGKFAIERFAKDLLESADNLGRALSAAPEDSEPGSAIANFIEGVAATERALVGAFEKHGMVRLDPTGEKFDPNYHQAMFEVPNSGQVPGTVVQTVAVGWTLNGRLARPAMVGVAKGEAPAKVDTEA